MFRPVLLFATIITLACTGISNGWVTVAVLKEWRLTSEWKALVGLTSLGYPAYVSCTIILIDVLEWFNYSREEFDASTVIGVFLLWVIVSIPTSFLGG
jgi:hypothetical protein